MDRWQTGLNSCSSVVLSMTGVGHDFAIRNWQLI